ncbi:MAG: heat shock protein HspQ [Tatlockia sp.]|jgi:heat shock protein HspQ
MQKAAKFNIGERVIHTQFGYRAVIIDADPLFQASGRYNPQAIKRPFATKNPWYRLLVDGKSQMTYVEECLLRPDPSSLLIDNPNISHYLQEKAGRYHSTVHTH